MKKGIGIKVRTAIATVIVMAVLTTAIAAIGYKLYHDSVMENYITYKDTVLEYAYAASVKYEFGDMIAAREMPEGYEEFRKELNTIKESSRIEYLYAIYFDDIEDMHSLTYAINAKTDAEVKEAGGDPSEAYTYMGKPTEEGAFQDDVLAVLQEAVKNGKRDSGTLRGYSEGYGYMLNGYRVIFDSNGNAVGLICVEIDINHIRDELKTYVRMVLITALIITAFIIVIYLINTELHLIRPIVKIAKNSDVFVKKMKSNADPKELIYENVEVKTNGEVRLLAENVKALADGVVEYMENLKETTAERERIQTELSLATEIQAAMLPHVFPPYPDRKEFDIYAAMDPAREVGGDFYDYFLIDEDHLGLVMADVSGKGIPAALFMMISKVILQSCAMLGRSPAEILSKTNAALTKDNQAEMFVTVWLGILEISTGKLTAANAGHEYPMIKRNGGAYEVFKDKHGLAIGAMEGSRYKEYEITLNPGDRIFLYTDGLPEATDSLDQMFGMERTLKALNAEPDANAQKLLENVKEAVNRFVKDAEQFDDLTMMCFEYNECNKKRPEE